MGYSNSSSRHQDDTEIRLFVLDARVTKINKKHDFIKKKTQIIIISCYNKLYHIFYIFEN